MAPQDTSIQLTVGMVVDSTTSCVVVAPREYSYQITPVVLRQQLNDYTKSTSISVSFDVPLSGTFMPSAK